MAKILGLDGKEIKDFQPQPTRNAEVDRLLEHIGKLNAEGRLKSITVSAIEDDDRCGNAYVIVKPVATATLIGGLSLAATRIEKDHQGHRWIETK